MKIKKLAGSLTRDKAEKKQVGDGGMEGGGDEAEGWPPVAKVNWQFNKFAKFPRAELGRSPSRLRAEAFRKRKIRIDVFICAALLENGPRDFLLGQADVLVWFVWKAYFHAPREYLLIDHLFIWHFLFDSRH